MHSYSDETPLPNLSSDIPKKIYKGNVTAVVLLDMSAAFDTVDHPILTLTALGGASEAPP